MTESTLELATRIAGLAGKVLDARATGELDRQYFAQHCLRNALADLDPATIKRLTDAVIAGERRAPVQGYPQGIPWLVHLLAYEEYAKQYGREQSAERIAQRGGFDTGEMDDFVPYWRAVSALKEPA